MWEMSGCQEQTALWSLAGKEGCEVGQLLGTHRVRVGVFRVGGMSACVHADRRAWKVGKVCNAQR